MRLGFPSWSWIGWSGVDAYRNGSDGSRDTLRDMLSLLSSRNKSRALPDWDEGIELKIRKVDGTDADWADLALLSPLDRQTQISRFLVITAFMTEIDIVLAPSPGFTKRDCLIREDSTGEIVDIFLDYREGVLPSQRLAICLPRMVSHDGSFMNGNYLIVGLINGVYERMGFIQNSMPFQESIL